MGCGNSFGGEGRLVGKQPGRDASREALAASFDDTFFLDPNRDALRPGYRLLLGRFDATHH